jgi:hypothetical protein
VALDRWIFQLEQQQNQRKNSNSTTELKTLVFPPVVPPQRSRRYPDNLAPLKECNLDLHAQIMADGVYMTFTNPKALCGLDGCALPLAKTQPQVLGHTEPS